MANKGIFNMRNGWLAGILGLILCLALVFSVAAPMAAEDAEEGCDSCQAYPIMHPDRETREEWIEAYNSAPRAYIEMEGFQVPSPTGSLSLLDHLDYTPAERNQGDCGNCWAWAGTGCLGIALDVQEGIKDRLSVQYINSCGFDVIGTTCCEGAWLFDLADFYDVTGMTIPWSNTNAHWQDGDASCDTACSSISTTPNYPITSIQEVTIPTQGVGQATAIANIKNVLNQNKAVFFSFFLPNSSTWDDFNSFWNASGESVLYDMDQFCGIPYDDSPDEGGGHAVLCVGYNDDDPNNSYWIMLNSWGTGPTGNRPNGLFRIDMDMNYQCVNNPYYSFYWETLDVAFGGNNPPNVPSAPSPPNHATGVSINADLSWTGGDPDVGDIVTYDVHFGTSATPPLVSNDQTGTTYDPGTLSYNTKYYWKIVATDNHAASTTGPLWDFTTSSTPNNPPQLSSPSLQPPSGSPSTGFYYYVNYYDSDGDSPNIKRVYIDGTPYTMSLQSGSAPNGVYRYGPKNLSVGSHNYYFYFEDGKGGTARLPTSGSYSGPVVSQENNPPQLSSPSVQPPSGTPSTSFYHYVNYYDSDGDSPNIKRVYIDGTPYTMSLQSGSAPNGVYRYGPKNLSVGSHNYYFYFEDGKGGTARLPTSGSYSGPVVSQENNPPNTPSNPSPGNHASGVPINADLSWTGGDPDAGDTVTYDVYFGTSATPPLVSNDQLATTYDLGTMNNNTKYYWYIVATDNHSAWTTGPLWDFTTASQSGDENNPAVEVGLASLGDRLVIAYGYKASEGVGGWTVYNPEWAMTHPDWNTLTTLYMGRGYWINVEEACSLEYDTQVYGLDAGWNLIGWLGW